MSTCLCRDEDAFAVAALMADYGMGQWEASRIVFGGTPSPDAGRAAWSAWVGRYARDVFAPLREAVGLR